MYCFCDIYDLCLVVDYFIRIDSPFPVTCSMMLMLIVEDNCVVVCYIFVENRKGGIHDTDV